MSLRYSHNSHQSSWEKKDLPYVHKKYFKKYLIHHMSIKKLLLFLICYSHTHRHELRDESINFKFDALLELFIIEMSKDDEKRFLELQFPQKKKEMCTEKNFPFSHKTVVQTFI